MGSGARGTTAPTLSERFNELGKKAAGGSRTTRTRCALARRATRALQSPSRVTESRRLPNYCQIGFICVPFFRCSACSSAAGAQKTVCISTYNRTWIRGRSTAVELPNGFRYHMLKFVEFYSGYHIFGPRVEFYSSAPYHTEIYGMGHQNSTRGTNSTRVGVSTLAIEFPPRTPAALMGTSKMAARCT